MSDTPQTDSVAAALIEQCAAVHLKHGTPEMARLLKLARDAAQRIETLTNERDFHQGMSRKFERAFFEERIRADGLRLELLKKQEGGGDA